jgi:predicted PurR-regulated permease PerM
MQLFGLPCVLAYCVAALIVGVRLVCLASRTRELPELIIALCITYAFYPPQAYLDRIRKRAGLEVS